jgi:hypothetical protein
MRGAFLTIHFLAAAIVLFGGGVCPAQPLPGLSSVGVDAALTRLLGENRAFSADALLTVYNSGGEEILAGTMGFAVRDERVRLDVDVSKLRTKHLPAGLTASLKQVGMEQVVSLILPEQESSYLIYPGLESILRIPMETSSSDDASKFQLERKAIGTESLEGHACVKYRVTVTDAAGTFQEAVTWNATQLKEFPLQIQMQDGENQMILRFRNVRLEKPGEDRFRLPSGYTRYDSQEALMQAVMMKALSGLGSLNEP